MALELAGAFANDGFKLRDGHWAGTLAPGESKIIAVNLYAGNEYWLSAGATEKAKKLTVECSTKRARRSPREKFNSGTKAAAGSPWKTAASILSECHWKRGRRRSLFPLQLQMKARLAPPVRGRCLSSSLAASLPKNQRYFPGRPTVGIRLQPARHRFTAMVRSRETGPTCSCPHDSIMKVIRPSFGYVKGAVARTEKDGYVANEDIRPAPADARGRKTSRRRRNEWPDLAGHRRARANSLGSNSDDPRLIAPPEAASGGEPTPDFRYEPTPLPRSEATSGSSTPQSARIGMTSLRRRLPAVG